MFTLSIKGHWQPAHAFATHGAAAVLRQLATCGLPARSGTPPHPDLSSDSGSAGHDRQDGEAVLDGPAPVQRVIEALVEAMPLESVLTMLQVCSAPLCRRPRAAALTPTAAAKWAHRSARYILVWELA